MSFCNFADGAALFDATPIENMFLMEYLYDAPAPALKVYLYARMLALHPELGGSMADLAKALRMEEDDVYDAFVYWERRELAQRLTDNPPTYAFLPLRGHAEPAAGNALDREMYANREFNSRLRRLFGDEFIGDHELRKAGDWINELKFDQEAILRMVEYGIQQSPRKNPKPPSVFKRVDKLAEAWSQKGIHTLEDVERAIAEESGVSALAREVLQKLGKSRAPSEEELKAVQRWLEEWGYTPEEILDACKDTFSAGDPTMKYLDSILNNRRAETPALYAGLVETLRELNPRNAQPTPDQRERYKALLDAGFAPEMIRLAAVQCHRVNRDRFDDLEWRLNVWRKDGVSTPEGAETYMRQMAVLSRQLREVFRKAGSDRRPGYGELETYRGWLDRYPDALIDFAAECSRNAGGSMAYMDKLLTQWAKDGVATVGAARAQHEAWRAGAAKAGAAPANPALDYAQREYRDEDFGDDFFVDLSQYAEEDKK